MSDIRVDVVNWVPLLLTDAAESAGLDLPLDSEARLLVDGVGLRTGVPASRGDSLADGVVDAERPLAPIRGVIWPDVALIGFVRAECRLARWAEVDALDGPTLPVDVLDAEVCVRPALVAVVPENVLGLSTLPLEANDALAGRAVGAASALAGLCLGRIPAASPVEESDGRPLPDSVEVEAADPARTRSASFLGPAANAVAPATFLGSAATT